MNPVLFSCLQSTQTWGETYSTWALPMLWQSTIVMVILLGLEWLLCRRISALMRYALLLLILVKLVTPTILVGPLSYSRAFIEYQTAPASAIDTTSNFGMGASAGTIFASELAKNKQPILINPLHTEGYLFLLWIIGTAALIFIVFMRVRKVYQLLDTAEPVAGDVVIILEQCKNKIQLKQDVKAFYIDSMISPAVCGIFHPVILLPKNLIGSLAESDLQIILMHELVHIQRCDTWAAWLQTILQIAYWYNPLLWFANQRIRDIREQAVDEQVAVYLDHNTQPYCETLLRIAKESFAKPALSLRLMGVFESDKTLSARIRHLLEDTLPRFRRFRTWHYVVIVLMAVCLLPMARVQWHKKAPALSEPISSAPMEIATNSTGELTYGGKTYNQWIAELDSEAPLSPESPISTAFLRFKIDEKAIPGILKHIKRGEEHAAWLLGKIGEPACPAILGLLNDSDPKLNFAGVQACYSLQCRAEGIVKKLNEMISQVSGVLSNQLQFSLEQMVTNNPDAMNGLIISYQQGDYDRKKEIAHSFEALGDKAQAVLPILTANLNDKQWLLRELACKTLARMVGRMGDGAKPVLQPLIKALSDEVPSVRIAAATALGWMGPNAKEALPALQKMKESIESSDKETIDAAISNISRGE